MTANEMLIRICEEYGAPCVMFKDWGFRCPHCELDSCEDFSCIDVLSDWLEERI